MKFYNTGERRKQHETFPNFIINYYLKIWK